MKKIVALFIALLFAGFNFQVLASHHHGRHGGYHRGSYYHGSSGGSSVYLINRDYQKTEQKFADCDSHYIVTETFSYLYSDGSRRSYSNSTIYNKNGGIIQANCQSVKHVIFDKQHYFLIRQGKICKVIDTEGKALTTRPYSSMQGIVPNRLLVRLNKKYGIIDLHEKNIAQTKYQKVFRVEENIFITKLNGYYGVLDADGKTLIDNEYDKITLINDSLLLKKYHKYGLASTFGKILLEPDFDKIKKMGEYIVVKKDKKCMVLDSDGTQLSEMEYKKIRLERNKLQGLRSDNSWDKI
ncbi:WG repeat-containing protein [bacterium]|nr:WG repeat-containing protein [bacterium]